MSNPGGADSDLELVNQAIAGDKHAGNAIVSQIDPIIQYQTNHFCKRFCQGNSLQYKCSLAKPIGNAPVDALSCEWGNASYGWMLDDLSKPQRLQKFQARNNSRLVNYLYNIANSLAFYERWKDWRFDHRQRVPDYIRDIGNDAVGVFYALVGAQDFETTAEKLSLSLNQVRELARSIVSELSRRQKLYLLESPYLSSLSRHSDETDDPHQIDVAVVERTVEKEQRRAILARAWSTLDVVEQFVLESLIVEEQDAKDVLQALATLDISIKSGVPAHECNRQQLYYFKRKALDKLQLELNAAGFQLNDFFK